MYDANYVGPDGQPNLIQEHSKLTVDFFVNMLKADGSGLSIYRAK